MSKEEIKSFKLVEKVKFDKDLDFEFKILWSDRVHLVEKDSMIRSFLEWIKDKRSENHGSKKRET